MRIGINGFGRMGRLAVRAAWDWPEIEIVQINELNGGAATAAHLLPSTGATNSGAMQAKPIMIGNRPSETMPRDFSR